MGESIKVDSKVAASFDSKDAAFLRFTKGFFFVNLFSISFFRDCKNKMSKLMLYVFVYGNVFVCA